MYKRLVDGVPSGSLLSYKEVCRLCSPKTLPVQSVLTGEALAELGFCIYISDPVLPSSTQKVVQGSDVEQSIGVWSETLELVNKTAEELAADKEEETNRIISSLDRAQFLIAFNHENRIRALEGKTAITQQQFRNAIKPLLT